MNFVWAKTSGGGVGSMCPASERWGVYDLVDGVTGPFGSSPRSRSFRLVAAADGGLDEAGCGLGVGGIAIGREGAAFCWPAPAEGPGDPTPFGPGLGAAPAAFETTAAFVGLGLGTPGFGAGATDARATGAGEVAGAVLAATATAAVVGTALGWAGAGVAGFAVGAAVGEGGLGDG
jgi:hypothetical protein